MQNKFYISCGLVRQVVLASNPIQAAIKVLQRLEGPTLLGGVFTVSQRGFEFHEHELDEDFLMTTEALISILMEIRKEENL